MPFEIVRPDIDEKAIRRDTPEELVMAIAQAKMDAVLAKISEPAIVITSDQVVAVNGIIFEKPVSAEEAGRMLRTYRTHPPAAPVAVVVVNTVTNRRASGVDVATTYFSDLPDALIDELANDPTIASYAGAFSVEDARLKPYVSRIDGTIDSVEGLPKELVIRLIQEVS